MAGKKGQKRRVWSDDEKRSICLQSTAPGVSVAQVARRYAMNSNLVFSWLRDPRFAPTADEDQSPEAGSVIFLPLELCAHSIDLEPDNGATGAARVSDAPLLARRVDITLSDGRRIVVEGPTALSAVVRLAQGLMT